MTRRGSVESRGQVLLIAVAAMIVLIGIAAVAIDLGFSWMLHRQEQDAADPAALAAARFISDPDPLTQPQTYDAARGWDAACHYALTNGFFDPGNAACAAAGGTAMQVLWPPGPTAGSLAGDHGAVQVIITAQHPSFFGRIFGISTATVTTGAVAARQRGTTNTSRSSPSSRTGATRRACVGMQTSTSTPSPATAGRAAMSRSTPTAEPTRPTTSAPRRHRVR